MRSNAKKRRKWMEIILTTALLYAIQISVSNLTTVALMHECTRFNLTDFVR